MRLDRRKRGRDHKPGDLTREQRIELTIGPDRRSAFDSDEHRRQAWLDHQHEFQFQGFDRPAAWYEFTPGLPGRLWLNEPHCNFLERAGQLTADEEKQLLLLRTAGEIPPRCVTEKPKDELLRLFRYEGETQEKFRARFQASGVDPWA